MYEPAVRSAQPGSEESEPYVTWIAEQEPPDALGVLGGEELAQEEVGAVERPEGRLEHALAEDPALVLVLTHRQLRFNTSWKSWNKTSMSSCDIPWRESDSRNERRTSTTW